jgi:CBS domain-containing protein
MDQLDDDSPLVRTESTLLSVEQRRPFQIGGATIMTQTLQDVLRQKGTDVYAVEPDATVAEVVDKLVECNCGSLLVRETGGARRMVGIITERDILKVTASKAAPLEAIRVKEVMSVELTVGSPSDTVESVMGLLTRERIRHLPVLENDELVGLISIGDVVKAQFDELATENHFLKEYIQS